jgi:hypothetical protein
VGPDRRLHVTVKKENYSGEPGRLVEKLVPLLAKYRRIIIDMYGFKRGELLEAIRPLSTKNLWATIIVYNGEKRDSKDYDEEITVP